MMTPALPLKDIKVLRGENENEVKFGRDLVVDRV